MTGARMRRERAAVVAVSRRVGGEGRYGLEARATFLAPR
jgi:hypothetical protein